MRRNKRNNNNNFPKFIFFGIVIIAIIIIVRFFFFATSEKFEGEIPVLDNIKNRYSLGRYMQIREKTKGVVLGAGDGEYSRRVLEVWKRCEKFYLVDKWESKDEDFDVPPEKELAQNVADKFKCAELVQGNPLNEEVFGIVGTRKYFDFVFYDYKRNYNDLINALFIYWDKLKVNGLFVVPEYEGKVKAAVDDFMRIYEKKYDYHITDEFPFPSIILKKRVFFGRDMRQEKVINEKPPVENE